MIFSGFFLAANMGFGGPTPATVTVQILPFPTYGTVSPNYNGQSLTIGKSYSMTAKAKSGFTFVGWAFMDGNGSHTNNKAKLTFTNGLSLSAYFVDKQKPTVSIQTPPNSGTLTNSLFITGTAKDNDTVTNVFYQLINRDGSTNATASTGNGWNNWWVNLTLAPNTNTLLVYAVDRSGNASTISKLKLTYSAAPGSLSGMMMTNPPTSLSTACFGNGTFSDETGVGSYIYKKTGPVTGKLSLEYSAPPLATSNNVTVPLQFTDATNGTFTNNGVNKSFSLSPADTLVSPTLAAARIILTSSNNDNQSLLVFLDPPKITDNGHLGVVANPLVVSLDAKYPGDIGDRVTVTFSHQRYFNGSWVELSPQTYPGTVIDFGTSSNTVTVLFDSNGFVTSNDVFAPIAGQTLNIQTYYYTDYSAVNFVTNGSGTFTYTNYSPVGSLLQLSQSGTNSYYILTFTNALDSGNYYVGNYGFPGNIFQGMDGGAFAIAQPPQISTQPQNVAVTNGGTATFTVTAAGTPLLNYQWQLNGIDLSDGLNISGSLSNLLTISNVSTNDTGDYRVVVTNYFGSVTSSPPAVLAIAVPPQITSSPSDQTATNGSAATFFVTAAGTPTLYYQWQFGGTSLAFTNIPGSTTTNLVINSISTNNIGNYQIVVTNKYGTSSAKFYLDVSN